MSRPSSSRRTKTTRPAAAAPRSASASSVAGAADTAAAAPAAPLRIMLESARAAIADAIGECEPRERERLAVALAEVRGAILLANRDGSLSALDAREDLRRKAFDAFQELHVALAAALGEAVDLLELASDARLRWPAEDRARVERIARAILFEARVVFRQAMQAEDPQ